MKYNEMENKCPAKMANIFIRGLTYKRLLPLWPLIGGKKDTTLDVRTSRCLGVGNPVYVRKPTVVPFLPPISGHVKVNLANNLSMMGWKRHIASHPRPLTAF